KNESLVPLIVTGRDLNQLSEAKWLSPVGATGPDVIYSGVAGSFFNRHAVRALAPPTAWKLTISSTKKRKSKYILNGLYS
ncbi:hypothetical protein HAX54_018319, partial [Datura stramonium]|nr:hypothetical protein [Datura stramonium]